MATDNESSLPGTPVHEYDIFHGDAKGFAAAVQTLKEALAQLPKNPLNLATGWHDGKDNPEIGGFTCEELLKRNVHNRPADFKTCLQYATAMARKQWKKTGQPLIITDKDEVEDAGHRLLAAYFGKVTFPTYVITDVPSDPDLFAHIDNNRPRTGPDILKIAGINGQSKLVSQVIKNIAVPYDDDAYTWSGKTSGTPVSLIDELNYARAHPGLAEACHKVIDTYPQAVALIGDKGIAAFVGWQISEIHGEAKLEEYMLALTDENLPATHPCAVFRKRLLEHKEAKLAPKRSPKAKGKLSPTKILGMTILAFNKMTEGVSMRRIDPRMDDPFPKVALDEEPPAQAAE
jgi:hypothetical protein